MIRTLLLSLLILSNFALAVDFDSDTTAIKDIESLLGRLDHSMGKFPEISCNELLGKDSNLSIDVPICSYQDMCSAAIKDNGFIVINGVKVPDYQLHTKLTQLKNNVLNCYDQLDEESETYKDLFSVGSKDSLINDLMPPHRVKKFQQIYNRIDYKEQLPTFFDSTISSTDLDTYLSSSNKVRVRDDRDNLITLDDFSLRRLVALNNFLISPSDEGMKNKLSRELNSTRARQRLDEYFLYNQGTKRQKLLVELEGKMDLRGFDYVDTKLFNDIKNKTKITNKESKLISRTSEIKNMMINKIKQQGMPREQERYFVGKLEAAKIKFMKPIEDQSCSGGTPAYANGFDFILCPKSLSLPDEAIDAIIGHELTHLIGHCMSDLLAKHRVMINGIMPPTLAESPFSEVNKCVKNNKALDIRVNFDPMNVTDLDKKKACARSGDERDQTSETFADLMSVATLEADITKMDKAAAHRYIVGFAFAKPFKCEENADFNKSEYDDFINETSGILKKAGCFNTIEPKTYAVGGPHLSMEDRVNHIFMTKEIQKKMGCTSTKRGRTKYAQENLECRI
jgi:hypothetical protein